ncbi:MAG: hypothetical protein AAF700_15125 [Pseudomonadota bacterium]
MSIKTDSYDTPSYPDILVQLLDLVQHGDDVLSHDASLVLRFYFERECLNCTAYRLSEVEAFLDFPDNLARATGARSIKELRVNPQQLSRLADTIFSRIEYGAPHGWRHAYALKQAICVPGLQNRAAVYLRAKWQIDEAVSLHLLHLIWETSPPSDFEKTLTDMSAYAQSPKLREHATQQLQVMKELQSKNADK